MSDCVIRLKCGLWEAVIDPNYGANVVCLTRGGQPVLRGMEKATGDPFLVGAPLLLPANRTAGGRFSFNGKEYSLPVNEPASGAHLHGRLYNATFSPVSVSGEQARLCYVNRSERYPFPFRLTVEYRLGEAGLEASYSLENTGTRPMPFSFGLHATFEAPDWFSVPLSACQEKDAHHIPTGRYIPLTKAEETYVTGCTPEGQAISGFYRSAGDTAVIGSYRYQAEGFDHWVLYNAGGQAGLLCVEPQLGGVDALNRPETCPVLQAGEVRTLRTRLTYTGTEGML